MSYFKALTDVMRDNKLWSQTKALYTYYLVRTDFKSGLSYPPKSQILTEVNLTDKQFTECLKVLVNRGLLIETPKELTDKDNKPYTITAYKVYGVGNDATDNKDVSDVTDTKDVKETSKKVKASNKK